MDTEQYDNKQRQLIVTFIVLVAVVLVVVGARSFVVRQKRASVAATATIAKGKPATAAPAASANTTLHYKDGTYKAEGGYESPGGAQSLEVSITIQQDTVSASSVLTKAAEPDSQEYQDAFAQGYKTLIIGRKLDDIHLSRVSGSSLTSGGFNNALEQIKAQAKT